MKELIIDVKCVDKVENSGANLDAHMQAEHVREMYDHFRQSKQDQSGRTNGPVEKRQFSPHDRRRNGICSFWNRGSCTYGEFCRFEHVQIVACRHGERCFRKSSCKFSHPENPFLGHRTTFQNQY